MTLDLFRRGQLRCLALLTVLITSCVSPPIGHEPGADERLRSVLSQYPAGSDADAQRLDRDVRSIHLDHPRHVPTLVADAALAIEAGDGERAMFLLDQALALEADNVDAAVLAVGQSVRDGDVRGAQRRLDDALRLRPDHPALHEASASIEFVEERYAEALLALADRLAVQAAPPLEYEAETGYPGAPPSVDAPGGRTLRRLLGVYARHTLFQNH
ncbi:MAG: tetratricopeptide repeat protein, partial [Planctomycetota bacterium]